MDHTPPMNTTTVVFFLSNASIDADLRMSEPKPTNTPTCGGAFVQRAVTDVARLTCGQL